MKTFILDLVHSGYSKSGIYLGPDPAPKSLRVNGILFQTAQTDFPSQTWKWPTPHTSPWKAHPTWLRLQAALTFSTQNLRVNSSRL